MKVSSARSACVGLVAAAAATVASGFSPVAAPATTATAAGGCCSSPSSPPPRRLCGPSAAASKASICSNINDRRIGRFPVSVMSRGGHLAMIFGNFFGGGGAFYNKIDYSALPHPCPELAAAAQEGRVLVTSSSRDGDDYSRAAAAAHLLHVATFAGGCFWGLELAFQRVPGVVHTAVGYAQGPEEAPTYDQVCAGATGHAEAVVAYYDPAQCSYESLLDVFFERVDPTTVNGQGRDRGRQYRTGVYFHTPEQETIARARFEKEQARYKRSIATECKKAAPFWPAEGYHQQYLEKGGRFNQPQSAEKGATDEIRCYG